MIQRLPDIAHYWGYNLEGTPVIPKMYYDVYSEEQRWKEICCWLEKLTKYTDELAQLVNWIKNNYATKDELADEVLKLNNRITQEVKDLNSRITQEVATLNTRIDAEINTLNKRVDTEVDTLNKRIDTEVDKLNKKDAYLENKIDDNFEILDTKIDDLETSQDEKRENLKNELNEKIDKNAETAKSYTDTEIEKLKNSIDEQITNISIEVTNINNLIADVIKKEKEDFNKLDQKLNEALKTSLSWNVTKGQIDSSIVANRELFNDLTDKSYRLQDIDTLGAVNVDELAESGLNTAGWAVCNSWLWDKSVKVYPQYMVDGVVPPTPPEPPSGDDNVIVAISFSNPIVEINGSFVRIQDDDYRDPGGFLPYIIKKGTTLKENVDNGIIPTDMLTNLHAVPSTTEDGRLIMFQGVSEIEQTSEVPNPSFSELTLIENNITLYPQFMIL